MMHSQAARRFLKNYRINLIIKILIVSDFMIYSANQLFAPIFAIYVTDRVVAGNIEVVGIATAIYFAAKAIFEIPVGLYIDKSKSEKDDLYTAIIGTVGTALVFLWYTTISSVTELYFSQAILGLCAAVAYPGWYAIFTKHIDKNEEAFEWSLYDVLLGIGMAGAAALGGFVVERYGFDAIFYLAFVSTVVGAFLLLLIQNKIYKK